MLGDDCWDSDDCEDTQYSDTSDEEVELLFSEGQENKAAGSALKSSWQVIDQENLEKAQSSALEQVKSILGCTTAVARRLLIHHNWDENSLFGVYADRGPEWLLQSASVSTSSIDDAGREESGAQPPQSPTVHCLSCLEDLPRDKCTTMECGHSFCTSCWQQYFSIAITEGKSRILVCMQYKCGSVCAEHKVKEILREKPALVERYERSLLESYIEDNKRVRWCPSVPHCGSAIRVNGDLLCEPECGCGCRFCFSCGGEAHSPCPCDMWAQWVQKSKDDSETANWMTANTKPCPKCSKPVEKNGGCNLVVCMCGQAFCWLCGAATKRAHTWTEIYGHECGRWKDDLDKDINVAHRQLERYVHYHTRWKAHMDSLALEKRQGTWFTNVKEKLAKLENKSTELCDFGWLHQALQQLLEARRVLGYSYAFAFFMFGDMFKDHISKQQNLINQNLFEDQQQQLESEVERLSGMVQESNPSREVRLAVINSSVNVETRSAKLYDLIDKDILGPLDMQTACIAPYRGTGACRQEVEEEEENQAGASGSNAAEEAADAAGPSSSGGTGSQKVVKDEPMVPEEDREGRGKRPVDNVIQEDVNMMKRNKSNEMFTTNHH